MCLIDVQRLSMIIFEHGDLAPKVVNLDAAIFLSLVDDGRRSYERVLVAVYTAAVFETEALVAAWAVVLGTWLYGPVDAGNACGLGYRCSYTKRLAIVLEALFFKAVSHSPR